MQLGILISASHHCVMQDIDIDPEACQRFMERFEKCISVQITLDYNKSFDKDILDETGNLLVKLNKFNFVFLMNCSYTSQESI